MFLGLWILLYLLDANQGNVFVQFVQGMADSLAWWARDIFTMDTEGLRVVLNCGLPAAIYLLAGHLIAGRVRRLCPSPDAGVRCSGAPHAWPCRGSGRQRC
ncbi:hypothetical protein T261_7281 [Streptomyces lydicus]|nr:hypothetical protein T261_7281 [Streptomyces lydicus]